MITIILIALSLLALWTCFGSTIREYPQLKAARAARMSPDWPVGFGKGRTVDPVREMERRFRDQAA